MRVRPVRFAIAALLVAAAPAQDSAMRVFHFSRTWTAPEAREVTVILQTIAAVTPVSTDLAQRTLSVSGTAGQIALAGWLLNRLDRPSAPPPPTKQDEPPEIDRYRVSTGDEVHIVYMPDLTAPISLAEVATVVRTLGHTRRLYTIFSQTAAIARGTPDQLALTDWLFSQLSAPSRQAPADNLTIHRYPTAVEGDRGTVAFVKLFYLPHGGTTTDFQEIVTMARWMADIRELYSYNQPRAIAARGTAEQLSVVEWLFRDLDRAATESTRAPEDQGTHEFRRTEEPVVVHLFYLSHNQTPERVDEIASKVRAATHADYRLEASHALRLLALCGTADQIADAERLVKELDN